MIVFSFFTLTFDEEPHCTTSHDKKAYDSMMIIILLLQMTLYDTITTSASFLWLFLRLSPAVLAQRDCPLLHISQAPLP